MVQDRYLNTRSLQAGALALKVYKTIIRTTVINKDELEWPIGLSLQLS